MAKNITVAWRNPAVVTTLDHIEIWRKTGIGGSYAKVSPNLTVITASTLLDWVDDNGDLGLADGQEYYYQVRTYDALGNFTPVEDSLTISGVFIAPPSSFAAGTPTTNTIPLTWAKSVTGIMTQYRVYDDGVLLQTFVGDVDSGTLTGLLPATNYTNLTVRAFNGSSESADSNSINVTTDADVTAPLALYAYIDNSEPDTITVVYNEPMQGSLLSFIVRGGAGNPTGNPIAITGVGTNILKFQFATAWAINNTSTQITFTPGHNIRDMAGNIFVPGTALFVVNMIEGTGTELTIAGAHSKLAVETNSIAMWSLTSATASVETSDTKSGLYAAKITSSSAGIITRGTLSVNVDSAKNYKSTFWAKKVGGTVIGAGSPLDGSSTVVSAQIPNDGIWRPYSLLCNDPNTNVAAAYRFQVANSAASVIGEYILIDELTFKEY
jgi:hypothetical protein